MHGRIVKKLKDGKYEVIIKDKLYNIKSHFHYENGEKVLVLFPSGQTSDLYIYPNKL